MLETILTGTTCGLTCWYAREDICRCSCGGVNHGCLRGEGGEQPARTRKIAGYVYQCISVTTDYSAAENEVRWLDNTVAQAGIVRPRYWERTHYAYWLSEEKGKPAIRKQPSDSEIERWPELAAYRDRFSRRPQMVWLRTDCLSVLEGKDK